MPNTIPASSHHTYAAKHAGPLQVQVNDEMAIVREGQLVAVLDVSGMLPQLLAARPAAILADGCPDTAHTAHAACQQAGQQPQGGGLEEGQVGLWGHGIADPSTMVVCRQGGESGLVKGCQGLSGQPRFAYSTLYSVCARKHPPIQIPDQS